MRFLIGKLISEHGTACFIRETANVVRRQTNGCMQSKPINLELTLSRLKKIEVEQMHSTSISHSI